jgi:Na+-driven multidrug efflux pump
MCSGDSAARSNDDETSSPPHDGEPASEPTAASTPTKGGLRELLRIAIPTALANLAEYLPVSVALYFIGRRGSADDLDAVGLGRSYFNISCFSTSYGLISALRTLCPQAAGAKKGKELHGLYAQRALAIVALAAVIGITGIHFADAVLIHVLGQPRQLARRAKRYGLALLPALFGIPCMTVVQRVMTAEGHVFANLAICAAVFATAPFWQNFLVYRHGLGFVGAAWASSITNNQYLLLQIPYCLYVGLGHVFRPRSIREVFDRRGIREFLGLSLPGLVASLLEWWSMEFVIALAGTRRSPAVLAAVVCALNVQTVLEMCWLGGARCRVDGVSVGLVSLTARGPTQARWSQHQSPSARKSAPEIPRAPEERRGSAFWPRSAPRRPPPAG